MRKVQICKNMQQNLNPNVYRVYFVKIFYLNLDGSHIAGKICTSTGIRSLFIIEDVFFTIKESHWVLCLNNRD